MNDYLKELTYADDFSDKIEVITFLIGIVTLIVAAVGLRFTVYSIKDASRRASEERNAALQQAKHDLRWRQTVEAQAAIRRLLDDRRAFDAMTMLDWDGERLPVGENDFKRGDVVDALKANENYSKPPRSFIRAAFDAFFTHLELIEQAIKAKIFTLDDVKFPINYYVRKMQEADVEVFKAYTTKYEFKKAQKLINDILAQPDENSSPGA